MNKIFAYILIFGTIIQVSGQSPDVLIWKNDTFNIYSNPLKKRTDWQKINQSISKQFLDKQISPDNDSIIEITPFFPYYKTEWKIENENLYLEKITPYQSNDSKLDLTAITKDKKTPIFADWLTGKLILFEGKCIICGSNHLTKTSIYPNEIILKFKRGILVSNIKYENRILKKSKLSKLDPNEYLEYIYSKVKWEKLTDLDNNYQIFLTIKPDKNGRIQKIDWDNTYLIVGNKIISNKKNIYLKEAVRIAKIIPDWNVILRHDKIIKQSFTILFSKEMEEKYAR